MNESTSQPLDEEKDMIISTIFLKDHDFSFGIPSATEWSFKEARP